MVRFTIVTGLLFFDGLHEWPQPQRYATAHTSELAAGANKYTWGPQLMGLLGHGQSELGQGQIQIVRCQSLDQLVLHWLCMLHYDSFNGKNGG